MTSWISGGLSQFSSLTDQITTFTKDVLTETTEEIEDPTAELQVARKKIEHLEEINNHYKTEWEKLQRHSEEVRERAETAECQIAAISQQYRKFIHEKDTELRRLRTEAVDLKEQRKRFVSSDGNSSTLSPLKELVGEQKFFHKSDPMRGERTRGGGGGGGGGGRDEGEWEVAKLEPVAMMTGGGWDRGGEERGEEGGWPGEYHDFGDVISSQGEINRLQTELSRVKVESNHWRTLAEDKGHSTTDSNGPLEAEVSSLREQVEDLQLCLQRERTQHQHQLTLLKAAHAEEHIQTSASSALPSTTLSSHNTGSGDNNVGEDGIRIQLKDAMGEGGAVVGVNTADKDETIRGSLLSELEEVSLLERDEDQNNKPSEDTDIIISSLRAELAKSQQECVKLESKIEKFETEQRLHQEIEKERKRLVDEVTSLREQKATLEDKQTGTVRAMEAQIEELRKQVKYLEVENVRLVAGGDESMSQLQTELKNTLSTNKQLRIKVESLEAEKSSLNDKATELVSTLNTQKEIVQQLKVEVEYLKGKSEQERQSYTEHVTQEKEQLTTVITELQNSISQQQEYISNLTTKYEQSQREAETLAAQVNQLVTEDHQLGKLQGLSLVKEDENIPSEASFEMIAKLQGDLKRIESDKNEIVSQLTLSLSSVNVAKCELEKSVEKLSTENTALCERLKELEVSERRVKEELEQRQDEIVASKDELCANEDIRRKLGELLEARETRLTQLETENSEVKAQLSQLMIEKMAIETNLREKEMLMEHSERNLHEVGQLLASRDREISVLQREARERIETTSTRIETDVNTQHSPEERVARDKPENDMVYKESEIDRLGTELASEQEMTASLNNKLREVTTRTNELTHLLEVARREVEDVKRERDGLVVRVQEVEENCRMAREEVAAKQTECSKLTRQLEHLKSHLVQVEDQYMDDALKAEEREKVERQRAENLKETLRNTSCADQQENLQTKAQTEALKEQLHALAGQRDAAVLELNTAREEAENNASALNNLQTVLEQFQRDQSSELSMVLKKSQKDLATAHSERDTLHSRYTALQGQLQEARTAESVARQHLKERETTLEKMQREVTGLQTTLKTTEKALEKLICKEGGRVDQNLVKNLVLGYVQAPDRKKPEVLNLIAKILDFSPSEVNQVQSSRSGWFGSIWGPTTPPPVTTPKLPAAGSSLSQLFVSFLETESTPTSISSSLHSHPLPLLSQPPPGHIATDRDRPSRAAAANYPSLTKSSPLSPSSTTTRSEMDASSIRSIPVNSHTGTLSIGTAQGSDTGDVDNTTRAVSSNPTSRITLGTTGTPPSLLTQGTTGTLPSLPTQGTKGTPPSLPTQGTASTSPTNLTTGTPTVRPYTSNQTSGLRPHPPRLYQPRPPLTHTKNHQSSILKDLLL